METISNAEIHTQDPRREIWRLRLNWLFLITIGSLYAISYTAISSSFHQFMTNPKADDLRNTTAFEKVHNKCMQYLTVWFASLSLVHTPASRLNQVLDNQKLSTHGSSPYSTLGL